MLVNIEVNMELIKKEIEGFTDYINSANEPDCIVEELTKMRNELQKVSNVSDFLNPISTGIYYGYWDSHNIKEYCGLKIEQFDSFNSILKYPENSELWGKFRENHGTADTVEQIISHYPELQDDNDKYFIIYHDVIRKEQYEKGGFRYHKNGAYIGIQKPTHEYLYDDIHIDKIIIYHIYKIID